MTESTDGPVVCVGAGRMGRGIAHVFAYAGRPVTVVDVKRRSARETEQVLADAAREVEGTLGLCASLGLMSAGQVAAACRLVDYAGTSQAANAVAAAGVVFEAVPEVIGAKREALSMIGAVAGSEAIVASTTSTILADTLAELVETPSRFLNAHFLNPAFLIPLVELSPAGATSPGALSALGDLLVEVGKVPVRCNAAPGYIVPRIQAAAMAEAARIVEEGVASAAEVDRAIRTGFGPRYTAMGMVEFIDWGGVDILYHACRYLNEALATERFTPPPGLEERMHDGRRGLREGEGYYDYRDRDVEAYRRGKLGELVSLLRHLELLPVAKVSG